MRTEENGPRAGAGESGGAGGTGRMVLLVAVGVQIAGAALWMLVHFGAETLAGVGWVGEPGRLVVTKCYDGVVIPNGQDSGGSDPECFGTFRPAGGGPEVTGVEVQGGRGNEYLQPGPQATCDPVYRPWWCGDDRPAGVAARYLHGDAWIFGNALFVPGSLALVGLSGVGLGVLTAARGIVRPNAGLQPPWFRLGLRVAGTAVFAGFLGVLLGLVLNS